MNKSINLKGKFATASSSLITRDMSKLVEQTGNLYEAVAVISKRANQIAVMMKEELNTKLADFASTVDNLEEVHENREQIEISKYYERMPKATSIATDEYLDGKLKYRYKDKE
jgi:DNA-directed RNA polymerase subunit K/omega